MSYQKVQFILNASGDSIVVVIDLTFNSWSFDSDWFEFFVLIRATLQNEIRSQTNLEFNCVRSMLVPH